MSDDEHDMQMHAWAETVRDAVTALINPNSATADPVDAAQALLRVQAGMDARADRSGDDQRPTSVDQARRLDGVEVQHPPLRGDHALPLRERGPLAHDLVDQLGHLGRTYGALGVAMAAVRLTDPELVVRLITDHGRLRPLPSAEAVSEQAS